MSNLPTIQELYKSKEMAAQNDKLTALLNQNPEPSWIKKHPFIRDYYYLPIERVEWLLKTIFKKYRIEILREGVAFNGVFVVVRIHYLNPVTNEMEYHDGIGATELQTKKGTSPADLSNINNGALGMAFPIAKTRAIKDACDHFGKLFGSDLNRKEQIGYAVDLTLQEMNVDHPNWQKVCEAIKSGAYNIDDIEAKYDISDESKAYLLTLKPTEDESI